MKRKGLHNDSNRKKRRGVKGVGNGVVIVNSFSANHSFMNIVDSTSIQVLTSGKQ